MTTVAQMIEWMKTLPQDAEVQCETPRRFMKPVNLECCQVYDYTSNSYLSRNYCKEHYPSVAGKIFVKICAE